MTGCSDHALLKLLAERGQVGVTTLADALETHPVTVSKRCCALQTDDHVRQVSSGVYAITDGGRTHLETLSE